MNDPRTTKHKVWIAFNHNSILKPTGVSGTRGDSSLWPLNHWNWKWYMPWTPLRKIPNFGFLILQKLHGFGPYKRKKSTGYADPVWGIKLHWYNCTKLYVLLTTCARFFVEVSKVLSGWGWTASAQRCGFFSSPEGSVGVIVEVGHVVWSFAWLWCPDATPQAFIANILQTHFLSSSLQWIAISWCTTLRNKWNKNHSAIRKDKH